MFSSENSFRSPKSLQIFDKRAIINISDIGILRACPSSKQFHEKLIEKSHFNLIIRHYVAQKFINVVSLAAKFI